MKHPLTHGKSVLDDFNCVFTVFNRGLGALTLIPTFYTFFNTF
jgi:hypothetical protein